MPVTDKAAELIREAERLLCAAQDSLRKAMPLVSLPIEQELVRNARHRICDAQDFLLDDRLEG